MDTITTTARRSAPPLPREAGDGEALRDTRPPVLRRPPVPGAARVPDARVERRTAERDDPGQLFVSAVRAAAPAFAAAARVATVLVAEVVPPARHRRARCRLVLLTGDGGSVGHVFLGAAGRPSAEASTALTAAVAGWLGRTATTDGPREAGPAGDLVVDLTGVAADR